MKNYLVVNVVTGKPHKKKYYLDAAMYTEKGAKNVCTRLNKEDPPKDPRVWGAEETGIPRWEVMHIDIFCIKYPVKMVTRRNMMSGVEYQEAEDTPGFMSPASEAYWSK